VIAGSGETWERVGTWGCVVKDGDAPLDGWTDPRIAETDGGGVRTAGSDPEVQSEVVAEERIRTEGNIDIEG
jgi:hypothetical protein